MLEVGVIADPQYADLPDRGTRAHRASVAKLGAAVDHFSSRPLDFCVDLGDTIGREWRSYDAILAPLAASRHRPVPGRPGNPDWVWPGTLPRADF